MGKKTTKTTKLKRYEGITLGRGYPGMRKSRKKKKYEDIPDGVKVIRKYKKKKCVVKGCRRNAVGNGDLCKKHGGEHIVKENLISYKDAPPAFVNGSKFDPSRHPKEFVELAREGMSEVEIAAHFEVGVGTLRHWAETFEEFAYAYEIGEALHEAWWLKQGKENLDNRGYNTGLFKFLTGNKLGYSDKIESKNLNVNAGVLMVPGQMSIDEWEQNVQESKKSKKR